MVIYGSMKTTVELPDTMFRQAKALAAARGISLRQLFTEALDERLGRYNIARRDDSGPPWMAGFGVLSDLSGENCRVLGLIEEEFERLDSERLA